MMLMLLLLLMLLSLCRNAFPKWCLCYHGTRPSWTDLPVLTVGAFASWWLGKIGNLGHGHRNRAFWSLSIESRLGCFVIVTKKTNLFLICRHRNAWSLCLWRDITCPAFNFYQFFAKFNLPSSEFYWRLDSRVVIALNFYSTLVSYALGREFVPWW